MNRLEGKVAIITGAGSGVGAACMKIFAAEGAKVVGVSRTKSNLEEVLAEVTDAGGEGHVVAVDLADPASASKVIDETVKKFGRLDILVNSAGVGYNHEKNSPGSMADVVNTTIEKWDEVMRINLSSMFLMCKAALPTMIRQKSGSIVNVTSISGYQGLPGAHTYTAAKAGMINLTRSMCVSYAKDGIRANAIAPGFIDTRMVADFMGLFDTEEQADAITPMRRAGTPEEMAYGCLYLASDEAGYCNGSILTIDGGTTARQ